MNQDTEKDEDGSKMYQQCILHETRMVTENGGRVGRTKTTTETLTLKEEEETLTLALDLSGIPLHTQNGQPLQWCPPPPFIAQGGKTVTKGGRLNVPFHTRGCARKAHHRYTLQILTGYKYTKWMCNVAHRTFTPLARFSASGRKSSRQRHILLYNHHDHTHPYHPY